MIQFLRKVRKILLNEGKIRSYLLYATGEIILLVIGILIALQINNWYDEYKTRKLEALYYHRLLEDITQDQLQLERLAIENETRIKSSNKAIHLLQQNTPDRKRVIKEMRGAIAKTTFTFKLSLAAFEDIKSSGSLNILKDLALKKKLINYYAVMEGYTDVVDVNSDAAVNVYFNPDKDVIDIGWQDIEYIKQEIDTTLVDVIKLNPTSLYPSSQIRKALLSDAIFYLGTNARKKELYQLMAAEIQAIKKVLLIKCKSNTN